MHHSIYSDGASCRLRLRDATFAVVDVETTGIDAAVDRVVEVACIVVRDGRRIDEFSSLVDPGRSIPAVASAIHHITDRHVRGAPRLDTLRTKLRALCDGTIVVAHNAAFDLRFLPFLAELPVLCTMRLAMRLIPDAPNYKNQVLRYHLGIEPRGTDAGLAHRAFGDAAVTSEILDRCLKRHLAAGGTDDIWALLRSISAPRLLPALPFGRHRGTEIGRVPTDYLQWVCDASKSANADARHTARTELQRRMHASQRMHASHMNDHRCATSRSAGAAIVTT